jgi:histone-binding protein RBBP4
VRRTRVVTDARKCGLQVAVARLRSPSHSFAHRPFTPRAGTKTLQATRKFAGHTDVVEDVAWHRHSPHLFASCGDDRLVALWDVRDGGSGDATKPKARIPPSSASAHKEDVMSLSFNPFQEFLLLTASVDKTVKLWDTRNLAKALHTFAAHTDEVLNGAYSWLLASGVG